MKYLIRPFILLICLLYFQNLLSQKIEINEDSKHLKEGVPFDKEFYYRLDKETGKLTPSEFIFQKKNKFGKIKKFTKKERKRFYYCFINDIDTISKRKWKHTKEQDKFLQYYGITLDMTKVEFNLKKRSSLYIQDDSTNHIMLKIPQLNPNTNYNTKVISIINTNFLTNKNILDNKLNKSDHIFFENFFRTRPYTIKTIVDTSYIDSSKESIGESNLISTPDSTLVLDSIQFELKSQTITEFLNFKIKTFNLDSALKLIIYYDSLMYVGGFEKNDFKDVDLNKHKSKQLYATLDSIYSLKRELLLDTLNINGFRDYYFNHLPNLFASDSCPNNAVKIYDNYKDILLHPSIFNFENELKNGFTSIDTEVPMEGKKCKFEDWEKRKSNFESTYTFMLKYKLYTMSFSDSTLIVDINDQLAILRKKIYLLEVLSNRTQLLSDQIYNYETWSTYGEKVDPARIMNEFKTEELNLKTTGEITLKSKGKFSVRPTLGAVYSRNSIIKDPNITYSTVIPFFGVQFNLRSLNPEIQFRDIAYKSIMHRSSINVAFSFTSVADGEYRYDLYKDNTLLLGYGFRLNNAFSINAGAMFFNKKNEDVFRSDKQLAAMPYLGITIDSGVIPQIKDFFDGFFSK